MEKAHLPEQIETERLTLKKHDLALAEVMFRYVDRDRERLSVYLPWVKFTKDLADEISFIKTTHKQWRKYEFYDFGLFRKEDGMYLGNLGVHNIQWQHEKCELGYWILGDFEGKGYMSEAVRGLTDLLIKRGFNRVEIRCASINQRSARVPQMVGYRLEGCFAQDHIENGEYRDTMVFAMTKALWSAQTRAQSSATRRPSFIGHWLELQDKDNAHYPGSDELLSIGSALGAKLGLKKIGIHHEFLLPGRRTSWPHAESDEEEFAFVIEGSPDVWIDGQLHRLMPGDAVAFPAGTGITHTFINNTESLVRLLAVGERSKKENKIYYPLHPARNEEIGESLWSDWPKRDLGPHDGLPDKLREK